MKTKIFVIFTLIIILNITMPIVNAHVPLESGDNDSLDHASYIKNPTKSWVIYDELEHIGKIRYYELELKKGERLKISVFTPDEGKFSPGIVVMGANFPDNSLVSQTIEIPEGFGTIIVQGERSKHAEYEPFTPSSSYRTAEFDEVVNESGKYYFAIFEFEHTGKFGAAVGYIESFSIDEWLLIPFDVINIHLWEGQSLELILAPLIIPLIIGLIIIIWRRIKLNTSPKNLHGWLGTVAGLLYMGSGFMILMQMGIALSRSEASAAVGVTLMFAAIPIILGFLILLFSVKDEAKLMIRNRIKIFIFGILGLIFWAGLIVGPIIIIVVSILPRKFKKN
jgi:hypothetical protein